jgi:hypothetical protein
MTTDASQQGREAAFVGALSATDDYLAAVEALSAALKAGWFALARAKYAAAPGALTAGAFPGDMRAAARVAISPPPEPEGLYDSFELHVPPVGGTARMAPAAWAENECTSGHGSGSEEPGAGATATAARGHSPSANGSRGGGRAPSAGGSGGDADAGSSGGDASMGSGGGGRDGSPAPARPSRSDALLWFGGGLPPADLRQAQRHFASALAAAVEAANRLQQLRGAADVLSAAGLGSDGCSSGDEGGGLDAEAAAVHAGP